MKRNRIFNIVAAVAAGFVTSCATEEFEPGPAADGLQVYFPNDIPAEYSLGDEVTSVSIPVKRIVSEGDLTMPVLSVIDDEYADIFDIPAEVSFKDGEKDSELTITFDRPSLEDGVTYPVSLLLGDEDNTTPYGNRSLSISITPWPWELMGQGSYRDDFMCNLWNATAVTIDVNIHKHKSKEGTYMVEEMFGWNFLTEFFQASKEELGAQFTYKTSNIVLDCSDPSKVTIPLQTTGVVDSQAGAGEQFISTAEGVGGTLKDGILTFPKGGLILTCDMGPVSANKDGNFMILFPGADASDYSLSVQYGGMLTDPDNTTASAIVDFTYGADVQGIDYVVLEGDKSADVENIALSVENGTAENVNKVADFVTGGRTASVSLEVTAGEYTVVALPETKDGKMSAQNASSSVFYFPGSGTSVPECEASVALFLPSEYPEIGSRPDVDDQSSVVFELKGKELKTVKYLMAPTSAFASVGDDLESVILESGYDLDPESIQEVNSVGKTWGLFNKLDSGTSYTIAIYAKNKYGKSTVAVSDPKSTADIPYSGELRIGQYNMTCTVEGNDGPFTSDNTFRLSPTAEENVFTVCPLALDMATAAKFYARYDPEKLTLTLDGTIAGREEEGNLFGAAIYYYNNEQTQVMGWFSYTDPQSETASYPAVFSVSPDTKQLDALETYLEVFVADAASNKILGLLAAFHPGKTALEPVASSASRTAPAQAVIHPMGMSIERNVSMYSPVALRGIKVAAVSHASGGRYDLRTLPVKTSRCELLRPQPGTLREMR